MSIRILSHLLLSLALLAPVAAAAQKHGHGAGHGHHKTPYAGQQTREVKSLSAADLAEIRRGGGWGFALPAELSGFPGPKHLLELRDELGLSARQVAAIEQIFHGMQADAIAAGERFIAAQQAVDAVFSATAPDGKRLRSALQAAAAARADLRFVHLSRHLETGDLLTAGQIEKYQILRGYAPRPR